MTEQDVKNYIEVAKKLVNLGKMFGSSNEKLKKVLDKVSVTLEKPYLADLVLDIVSYKELLK